MKNFCLKNNQNGSSYKFFLAINLFSCSILNDFVSERKKKYSVNCIKYVNLSLRLIPSKLVNKKKFCCKEEFKIHPQQLLSVHFFFSFSQESDEIFMFRFLHWMYEMLNEYYLKWVFSMWKKLRVALCSRVK